MPVYSNILFQSNFPHYGILGNQAFCTIYKKKKISEVGRDGLRVWDGNVVKLGGDDGCTTINIIKLIEKNL